MPSRRLPAATLAAVLALGTLTYVPAVAAPSKNPAGPAGRVTLITGDVVELTDAGQGRKAAVVQPAPGRERITFHTYEIDGGLRVLPSDAVPSVAGGMLDADLFDVEELIADGYGGSDTLPLIVKYADQASARATQPLAGTSSTRPLKSIGGAALTGSNLPELWNTLKPSAGARAMNHGISRVWLDGKVRPVLDKSTAQIGAPAAWQAGYQGDGVSVAVLDTGVDANHPDLAGKVKAAEDFTNSPTGPQDHFGHGTHVAATIAGTGAAAAGTRKGVAPKAQVLAGKVLSDDGYGYDSWIIAGMEWATSQGAKVINLSLGGEATDGTDPLSQAVNDLTARTGTLFVVSAGNEGQDESVGTPGAAAAALTVGAVDRSDKLASFSSRGPRVGDYGLKPEITAPGVGIVAARAAGTDMGDPLDNHYTAASGTSMAAPHVAGAAALLAQANPTWTADQLKNALVSTAAKQPDLSVFAQGAGRTDVARAIKQRVYATGVADFGSAATTKSVAYRNDTDAPVTLTLALDVQNLDSGKPEPDAITAPSTVTVPARGTAEIRLALTSAKLDRGLHSGWLVATGPDGIVTRTAVSAVKVGPKHRVTLRGVDLAGAPAFVTVVSLFANHSRSDTIGWIPKGNSFTAEVEEGTYFLDALITHDDPQSEKSILVVDPNLTVDRDLEVVLDARKATPVRIETPKPAEQHAILSYYAHRRYGNGRGVSHGVMHFSTVQEVRVTPTRPVADGTFEFSSRWQLVASQVQAAIPGVSDPLDLNLLHQSPTFDGKRRFGLVAPGADLAGVKGKVAVVDSPTDTGEDEKIAELAQAGAAGIILVRPADSSAWTVWRPTGDREPIPALVTTFTDGRKLRDRANRGNATIDLTLTPVSPYLYDVQQVSTGYVPSKVVHKVTPANSARVLTKYQDNGGFPWTKEQRFGWRPWQTYAWNDSQRFTMTPSVREEWVTSGDSLWQHRVHHRYTWDTMNPLAGGMTAQPRSYRPGSSEETWFGPAVRPAAAPGLVSARTGDRLSLRIPSLVDADGHYTLGETSSSEAKLSRNGQVVATLPDAMQDVIVPSGDGAYQLDLTAERRDEEWTWGTRTETSWRFRSAKQPDDKAVPLSLLQVDYDVPADLSGRVTNRLLPHLVGLHVHQPAGVPASPITAIRASYSTDQGKTWRKAMVLGALGRYSAVIPPGRGAVSLRVEATDRAGNSISQTIQDAYGLR